MNQLVEKNTSNDMLQNDLLYARIIEYSVETVIIHSDYKILYINQSGANLLKGNKEDLIGMNVLSVFREESKEKIKHRIANGMLDQSPSDLVEETIFCSDGTSVEIELYCHPIQFGGRKCIQTVLRDISTRKEAERLLNDREKLVSIGQIAAGIAHEVRNPLTAVKGFLQLLKESSSHPYLTTMEIELEKAIDTLQNLLQVSKPDLYAEPITRINLCKELTSLMFLFQDKLYNIEVELDLRDSDQCIYGKRNLFLKAFFNLIKNALEAMPSEGKIRIEHFYKDNSVYVKIIDTGIGVHKDKLKLLGTPFYSSKSDGTGLGLTQVFTTINDHGGHIQVQSELGIGTTFNVQLPIQADTV
ncbi:ATP-binding protein [Paenisporosarcina quisquiliarum]|uniref:ATP-binding protein n=1 Tax=Paenisporosarcina quisquiliarum TaxID=365346 RepID=UPI003734C8A9